MFKFGFLGEREERGEERRVSIQFGEGRSGKGV